MGKQRTATISDQTFASLSSCRFIVYEIVSNNSWTMHHFIRKPSIHTTLWLLKWYIGIFWKAKGLSSVVVNDHCLMLSTMHSLNHKYFVNSSTSFFTQPNHSRVWYEEEKDYDHGLHLGDGMLHKELEGSCIFLFCYSNVLTTLNFWISL